MTNRVGAVLAQVWAQMRGAAGDGRPFVVSALRPSRQQLAWWSPVIVAGLLWAGLSAAGWRSFEILTPSMGTALPVGTVVVTHPVRVADLEVGDVITFRPGTSSTTFTHRVLSLDGGLVTTQGDSSTAPDPWKLTEAQLVGTIALSARHAGWMLKGAPWLLLGWLALGLFVRRVSTHDWKWACGLAGGAVVFSSVALTVRPWVRAMVVGRKPVEEGLEARLASTGILPIKIWGKEGSGVPTDVLQSGQIGVATATVPEPGGAFIFQPTLALEGWWLVGVSLFVAVPVLIALARVLLVARHPHVVNSPGWVRTVARAAARPAVVAVAVGLDPRLRSGGVPPSGGGLVGRWGEVEASPPAIGAVRSSGRSRGNSPGWWSARRRLRRRRRVMGRLRAAVRGGCCLPSLR